MTNRQRVIIGCLLCLAIVIHCATHWRHKQTVQVWAAESAVTIQEEDVPTHEQLQDAKLCQESECDGIHVNSATLQQLQELPGIGPVLASRIIEERENGPFLRPQDLLRVKGIGPVRLENMLKLICMGFVQDE